MRRKLRYSYLIAVALTPLLCCSRPSHAQQSCQVPHFHFDSEVTQATMSLSSGSACTFHMDIPTSSVGDAGIISATPAVRPKNGVLGRRGRRIFAYKPAEGFRGSDSFEILVRYDRDNGQGPKQTRLVMSVTVY